MSEGSCPIIQAQLDQNVKGIDKKEFSFKVESRIDGVRSGLALKAVQRGARLGRAINVYQKTFLRTTEKIQA